MKMAVIIPQKPQGSQHVKPRPRHEARIGRKHVQHRSPQPFHWDSSRVDGDPGFVQAEGNVSPAPEALLTLRFRNRLKWSWTFWFHTVRNPRTRRRARFDLRMPTRRRVILRPGLYHRLMVRASRLRARWLS